MSARWTIAEATLDDLARVAGLIALKVRTGDVVALHGDLGAGKTTFARLLIRALLADPAAEVPSPTFPILQAYDTPRIGVTHVDLYRIVEASELDEIGLDEALAAGLTLVEWPQRAPERLPADRLDVTLTQGATELTRRLDIAAGPAWSERLARLIEIDAFLAGTPGHAAIGGIDYLQGDASTRAYARIATAQAPHVLMDAPRMPDGPAIHNGQPYSRIAHLAEDVRPFVAVGRALEAAGLSVPHIEAADLERGLLLLEDLGSATFATALGQGVPQATLVAAAVDVLLALRAHPIGRDLALPDGTTHHLPRFDRAALEIETGLLLDWFWPAVHGAPAPTGIAEEFRALWAPVLDRLLSAPAGIFLRDFHSPNLFWLPGRTGVRRIGVIDFQDALAEPWSHDLVSLLQDARVDVPAKLEAAQLDRYCTLVAGREPGFEPQAFRATYAAFGAQRNTRLVGLWVRLLRRDGKPGYLRHMPRTWDYLARNLAHPDLAPLRAWYDRHLPASVRNRRLEA